MSIAFDATATGNGQLTSVTFSHTLGSLTNGVIVVSASHVSGGGATNLTGITYNGVSMSRVDGYDVANNVTCSTTIYILATDGVVAAGAHNVIVTFDGNTDCVAGSLSFSGVDQATPVSVSHFGNSHGTSAQSTWSTTITSLSGEMVVGCLSLITGSAPVADGSITEKWNGAAPNFGTGAGGYKAASGTSETMQWTGNAIGSWSVTAASLKVASAGASALSVVANN